MDSESVNLWSTAEHAQGYLTRVDMIPHRAEGEAELLEWLPRPTRRVLDLGSGDGRLLALVRQAFPDVEAVALDFSETMLERLRARFAGERVSIVAHTLDDTLPASLGAFDAIVSSFAIHHVVDARKRTLYREIFAHLAPGGVFCNLEHVSSPTPALHERFLGCLGVAPADDDPSNKLLDVETQLAWLREIGFVEVDCHWKWRELALLVGAKPS
jgi:tRNA (cmo5U34)-methyltransferase